MVLFTVDSCPQRFDTGVDPYEKELKIYVMHGAASIQAGLLTILLTATLALLLH